MLVVTEQVELGVAIQRPNGDWTERVHVYCYVVEGMGNQLILGLPSLTGPFFHNLLEILISGGMHTSSDKVLVELIELHRELSAQLSSPAPDYDACRRLLADVNVHGSDFRKMQERIKDNTVLTLEDADPLLPPDGTILPPWQHAPEECEEDLAAPEATNWSDFALNFMESSREDTVAEYLRLLPTQISGEMRARVPDIDAYMLTDQVKRVFIPEEWRGLDIEPIRFTIKAGCPERIQPRARPIRQELWENAKKEFGRLRHHFYALSDSPIAAALVVAPKNTEPFIRLCGDYRPQNPYIDIPQEYIPRPKYEILKAASFPCRIDADMRNSFHQIPLHEESSKFLSVQTPWGLVRPLFMPEGVGPASGILQRIVRKIFEDFEEWTVIIFDNFLILGTDYADLFHKFQRVIERCDEYRIVLKLSKTWIGFNKVTFFGYEITEKAWRLSETRKDSIDNMSFPATKKAMQTFLGASLFFHHHVADYSEWSARLYEMTHDGFKWEPSSWTFDYRAHFDKFKLALRKALELIFPDYSLPWKLRVDASDFAVGAVLYQEFTDEDGAMIPQPIGFTSKRFSKTAANWDTFKREAYAIFTGVQSFDYYVRGKFFLLETDHRNLLWIEASLSAIVVRWKIYLQGFFFLLLHIAGALNRVADWLSR
jgi:phospholipid-translocating ATPase